MNLLVKNIANLLKIKSLITMTVIGVVSYGFIVGNVEPATYAAFGASIITYYFTRKEKGDE